MMDIVLLISRVLLAAVFAFSGAGKLADLAGSSRAVAAFGVPKRFVTPIGVTLPFVEMALALLLLPAITAWWGALGGLLLLLGFTLGMGVTLARGQQPDCHCFGAIHSEPVSARTVVRNVAFAAIATVVVVGGWNDPGPSVFAWLDDAGRSDAVLVAAGCVLMIALIGGTVVVAALLRRLDALSVRLHELEVAPVASGKASAGQPDVSDDDDDDAIFGVPVGTPAPQFEATSLAGGRFSLDTSLFQTRQLLLVFINVGCSACEQILPRLARWRSQMGDRMEVVVLSRGGEAENRAKAQRTKFPEEKYLVQEGHEVSEAYGVTRVPVALHIAPDGTLMAPAAGGAEAIADLLDTITSQAAESQTVVNPASLLKRIRAAFGAGDSLPRLTLLENGIDSVEVPVPDRRTLMIFWSPDCPFCQRLLLQLREWETTIPDDLTLVVIVTSGNADATRKQGLRSMIVEDDGIARAHYEVSGTPLTALANPDGTLAKPIAIGLGASLVLIRDAMEIDSPLRDSG